MELLVEVWQRATARQATPPLVVVVLTGALAALLVWPRPSWRRTRHLVTIAHEGAHGLAAVLSGRRLGGIRLHRDTSGLTTSRGRPHGPAMVLTLAAGYPGPALVGVAAAWALAAGWAVAVLWFAVALLALVLVHVRNLFGLVSVLVTAGVVVAVSWWATSTQQSAFAHVVVWFLLLAAPRPVLELVAERRRRSTPGSDPDQLAALTGVPALVWIAAFALVTGGALLTGAALLTTGAPQ